MFVVLFEKPNLVNDYNRVADASSEERRYITKEASLDPNHTHFILVDNAKLNAYEGEIAFRADLEKLISDFSIEKDYKCPIVVIVAGQWAHSTLFYVINSYFLYLF